MSYPIPFCAIVVYPNHRINRLKVSRAMLALKDADARWPCALPKAEEGVIKMGDAGILQLIKPRFPTAKMTIKWCSPLGIPLFQQGHQVIGTSLWQAGSPRIWYPPMTAG